MQNIRCHKTSKIAELSNITNSKSLAALITIIFNDNSIENYQHSDEKDTKEWKTIYK